MVEKKMITNTAYLLNTWFPEDSTMWKGVRKFISDAHKEHWKGMGSNFVEVTFKLIKPKKAEKKDE